MRVSDESLKNPIPLFTDDGKGYLDHATRSLEEMMEKLELMANQENEPMVTAAPHADHLRRHKESLYHHH